MPKIFNMDAVKEIEEGIKRWERETLPKSLSRYPERLDRFTTLSDIEVKRVYTPADLKDHNYMEKLGLPGEYPFTRGIHATMYRGRIWTMRMFSG
ncbi:methylmalonyl-CoA mutase, partial [Candidatus Geothermarchaeota archaeon]